MYNEFLVIYIGSFDTPSSYFLLFYFFTFQRFAQLFEIVFVTLHNRENKL